MGRGHYDRQAARERREQYGIHRPIADLPPAVVVPPPNPLPSAVPSRSYRMMAPHGFIETEHGKGVFHWEAGEIVTRPATIALLQERGALMEPI